MTVFDDPVLRLSSSELEDCSSSDKQSSHPIPRYFDYLPVGLFASVMGLTGLSVAWRLASITFRFPGWIADCLALLAIGWFAALTGAYAAKMASAPDTVRTEFHDPIVSNLFGTFFVSILLISVVLAPTFPLTARAVWFGGTVGMIGFAWLMIDRWMSGRQQVAYATPAWIIPVVGLLNVPLAVPSLNLPQAHGLMVFCLAIGLFFALLIFTIVLARLLFAEPLAQPQQPMLLILVAPFAVGFSAYVATTGRVDLFAQGLYGNMLLLLLVILGRMRHAARCCPFRIAWWAVSFPMAASAVAAIRFAAARPAVVPNAVALLLLSLASLVVGYLTLRTAIGILRGELKALT